MVVCCLIRIYRRLTPACSKRCSYIEPAQTLRCWSITFRSIINVAARKSSITGTTCFGLIENTSVLWMSKTGCKRFHLKKKKMRSQLIKKKNAQSIE